jgi:hypothetical protein
MLHEMRTSVEPLEERVRLLEAGSSEPTRLPKIALDRDGLVNMSKQLRNSESTSFDSKGPDSKSRNEE